MSISTSQLHHLSGWSLLKTLGQLATLVPLAPRVDEPQRQNPARHRSRSLRRRHRRPRVVLGAIVEARERERRR
jgi:hypothetical protein